MLVGLAIVLMSILAVGYGIHRAALWAEGRGWIYYRHRKAPPGAVGMALMELDRLWKPQIEHVIEEMRTGDHRAIDDENNER
jgi:hypothetical protein